MSPFSDSRSLREMMQNIQMRHEREWFIPSGNLNPREPTVKDHTVAEQEFKGLKETMVMVPVKNAEKLKEHSATFKQLGFEALNKQTAEIATRAMKENMIGLAGYKKIPKKAFMDASKRLTEKTAGSLTLQITPIAEYKGQHITVNGISGRVEDIELSMPPADVLGKLATAQKENLFDEYAIIHVAKVHDPILVGKVKGVEDLYFIAEWGDDVKLADLV